MNNFKAFALGFLVLATNFAFADRGGFGAGFGTGLAVGAVGSAIATRPDVGYYDYDYDYPADYRYARREIYDSREEDIARLEAENRRLRQRRTSNN